MAQVKKCFGDLPEDVVVLSDVVSFGSDGYADVSDEVAEVLTKVPGYELAEEAKEQATPVPSEVIEQAVETTPSAETALPEAASETRKKPTQRRAATSR